MKLYHIDRSGHIKSGETIDLINPFTNEIMKDKAYYKKGLSSHGIHYFTYDATNKDYLIDVVFEYERLINYPEKISRYQALFCFDEEGVIEFVHSRYLKDNFYKIYEVEVSEKKFERHNMELVRGWSHQSAIQYAKLYWEDKENKFNKDAKVLYEYLVKLPIVIGREVRLSELEKLAKNRKN